jgi:hypothetical protein
MGAGAGRQLQPFHQRSRLTLHHQIEIRQSAPGVVVHAVQQQIAHGTAHQRQPLARRRSDQGLNKLGRNARDLHGTCHEPWPSRQHHGEDPALATGGKPCADCSAVWGWH